MTYTTVSNAAFTLSPTVSLRSILQPTPTPHVSLYASQPFLCVLPFVRFLSRRTHWLQLLRLLLVARQLTEVSNGAAETSLEIENFDTDCYRRAKALPLFVAAQLHTLRCLLPRP